jgi:hypothetical protein
MILLFEIYEFSCSILRVGVGDFKRRLRQSDPSTEAHTFAKTVVTMLCAADIAFYVRFLVAQWKERKTLSSGYWVRLRLGSGEGTIAELPKRRTPVTRAA